MSHTRRKFDSEFRAGAVRIVRETRRPVVEIAREHLHERLILLHRRQPPPPAASATLQGLRGIRHLTLLSQRHAPTPTLRNRRPKTGHDPRITTRRLPPRGSSARRLPQHRVPPSCLAIEG